MCNFSSSDSFVVRIVSLDWLVSIFSVLTVVWVVFVVFVVFIIYPVSLGWVVPVVLIV